MLVISQHARLLNIPFPKHVVFRVNVAWIKTRKELFDLLKSLKNDVFLDFPEGRTKPPKPVLNFNDLIESMMKFRNIKYFAITDVKNADIIRKMRTVVPKRMRLVPKIESRTGIENLENIFGQMRNNEKYIMLDKEDLYTDLKNNKELFEKYIKLVEEKSYKKNIKVLELQGVIFAPNDSSKKISRKNV